eukprot:365228-Chlamydomonas_euryale.AAC.20
MHPAANKVIHVLSRLMHTDFCCIVLQQCRWNFAQQVWQHVLCNCFASHAVVLRFISWHVPLVTLAYGQALLALHMGASLLGRVDDHCCSHAKFMVWQPPARPAFGAECCPSLRLWSSQSQERLVANHYTAVLRKD